MSKRIILIIGNTETLSYFSKELATYLFKAGREVFIWDMTHPLESRAEFERLPDKEQSVLLTFNFIGLNGEGQFRDGLLTIWETNGIEIVSIMVDSPIYYYRQLTAGYKGLSVACIDKNHVRYVKKWHPYIEKVYFWPLCGNEPVDDIWLKPGICNEPPYIRKYPKIPLEDRFVDLVFIANYVTKESIYGSIEGAEPEYRDFLQDICSQLINEPSLVLEDTLYDRLLKEFPDEDEDSYPEAMFHMVYVDLYVRSHFRAMAVKNLVDSGFKVRCVGQDWDKLKVDHPDNLIHTNVMMTSADCVRALETAKVSLNVMPWFKDGAHDRVFSSMLAGCVSLTDSSSYLDSILKPWEDYAPWTLDEPESIIDSYGKLIKDPGLSEYIITKGAKKAYDDHRWSKTAGEVLKNIQ
ncbi:MAG: glycosyltransferase [Lachnospiraceae bacterium]|nr:glycosyltransferase [Lachnospiraceae bacterium]